MSPLLKRLLGSGSKDREVTDEMREILQEMQQERGRYESLVHRVHASVDQLQQLGEPIAKVASDVDLVTARLASLEQRLSSVDEDVTRFQALDERAVGLAQLQESAEAQIGGAMENLQRIRSGFEELSHKVDLAMDLKDRLGSFMDIEKPFQKLRGEAEALRGQVEGTGENLARMREQHDRLMDSNKLAMTKMEALDRRRDDFGRSLTDKERRVDAVELAVRGMDGVQHTVDEIKREIGTLKAIADTVVQKTAALEAQREAVECALAQSEQLDRAIGQIDAGTRQQQQNEKTLGRLEEHVVALRKLHEQVVERSGEISELQRETDEHTQTARRDLTAMTNEMKKTVERFDFESRGLELVHQRLADLRASLLDFENRFKGLAESRETVAELKSDTHSVAAQLRTLSEEVGHVDKEIVQLRAIRRELDEVAGFVRDISTQAGHLQDDRPAIQAALQDIEELAGAHALVKDALERTQLAHGEMTRVRDTQSETRLWLDAVQQSVSELRDRVADLNHMAPTFEHVQKQAQRITESTAEFESRRGFIEEVHRRITEVGVLSGRLGERGDALQARMTAAEERFARLEGQAEEAGRLTQAVDTVSSDVRESGRRAEEIRKTVAAISSRCQSIEGVAEKTNLLRQELDQRQQAVAEATQNFDRATELRQKAAASAHQLGELIQELNAGLATADEHVTKVGGISKQLEDRTNHLKAMEKRLSQFEERQSRWDLVEQNLTRGLEQIAARQGTVEAMRADLDRMFATAETTAANVREITAAQQELEETRKLLDDVMNRMGEVRDTSDGLEERKRQMSKAEERLARAEALLVDVRSSLEALQGQKAIVDQAVEKAGSLQFLLKQADASIEGLRQERDLAARVRGGAGIGRQDTAAHDDGEDMAKAA